MDELTEHILVFPAHTKSLPLCDISDAWIQAKLHCGPSTKATGKDSIYYYVLKLAGPAIYPWIRCSMEAIFDAKAPPEWSHDLLALVYKKGDSKDPKTYRPICPIQCLQKLAAAFLKDQFVQYSTEFSLMQKSQHGGLKNHKCGDHIHNVIACNTQTGGHAYHLHVHFNKAFNSVLHETLWMVLRCYHFPAELSNPLKTSTPTP